MCGKRAGEEVTAPLYPICAHPTLTHPLEGEEEAMLDHRPPRERDTDMETDRHNIDI